MQTWHFARRHACRVKVGTKMTKNICPHLRVNWQKASVHMQSIVSSHEITIAFKIPPQASCLLKGSRLRLGGLKSHESEAILYQHRLHRRHDGLAARPTLSAPKLILANA